MKTYFHVIFFSVTFLLSVVSADEVPVVETAQGSVAGTTLVTRGGRQIFAYLGIPYAAPPTGQLRFKSPSPVPKWDGVRNSKEAPPCLQQFVLIEKLRDSVVGSEDCLYLNVYSPKVGGGEKLPVMFFIHGGGYAGGSGSLSEYGPELLLDRDVLLVTINYRLGALGFLSTGDSVLPGNFGLKDQRAALRWVQDNIEHFGGDKDSVVIFGESAGGASVHLHMLSPKSQGLFNAGISESGTALCPWAFSSPARHQKLAAKLAKLLNCTLHPSKNFVDCLRALPAETIVGQLKHFIEWDMDPVVLFNPAIETDDVEDAFLTADPWTLTSSKPWMVGFNQNEGAVKASSLTQGDVQGKFKRLNEDFEAVLPRSLLYEHTAKDPAKVTQKIREFYFGESKQITLGMVPSIIKLYTDAWMMQGTLDAVRRHSGPVFVYYFSYNSSFSLCSKYFNNPENFGVCHFDELIYIFPMEGHAPKLAKDDPDYNMSVKMIQLWTNYAKNRTPKLDDSKEFWKNENGSVEDYLLVSKSGFTLQQHLLAERDQFWSNLPFRERAQQTNVTDEL